MPGFDAGSTVEALDWDFSTLINPKTKKAYVNRKGTLTEPSDQMIGDFLEGGKKIYADLRDGPAGQAMNLPADASATDMIDAVMSVTGKLYVDMQASLAALFGALCSGDPSTEELLALPLRARTEFYRWIQTEVVYPEAKTAAGNGQVISLPTAARG